jgi:hypothetical protein
MTSSSYTSAPFDRLQRALGDVVWRPKMYRDWLDAQREALATRWLAAKPHLKSAKRDDYKDECKDRFGISGRGYQFRVWPAARKSAGLTKHARPGPKKQAKK